MASALLCALAGRDPAEGVLITIPPHRDEATVLTFNLHNRHTYSEQDVKAGRAYSRYWPLSAC